MRAPFPYLTARSLHVMITQRNKDNEASEEYMG